MDLRALLVDDEQLARDELGYLLGQVGGVEVVAQAGNGVEALATIGKLRPDLIFLDVQMPGLTGFEVARRMLDDPGARTSAQIIFVTAYDQRAIEAFEVNAVDYLLKPVDLPRLEVAIERARRRISSERRPDERVSEEQLGQLVKLLAERQTRHDRLAIKVGNRLLLVQAEEIVCASLAEEAVTVVTTHHAGTATYRTLDELQARLDPAVFWRVHRSHLVNINMIREIVPWFSRNYILRMRDEKKTEVPVSRAQTRRLREYLKL